jgi:dipeptidyl aminopeptidase/acylaminoacyl peptidase
MLKTNQITVLFLFLFTTLGIAQTPAERKPIGNLLVENIPAVPPSVSETWEQYQNIRQAGFADWDASGNGIYIATRFGDINQIHHVNKAGSYREQVTFFKEPLNNVSTCPDPNRDGFLYARDNGGNEQFQIYFFDRKKGSSTLLTDGKSRNNGYRWSKKGDKFVYNSFKRNGKDGDFYVQNIGGEAKMILENKGGGWGISDWSADENTMIVGNYLSANETKLYRLDVKTGVLDQINPSEKQISYSNAKFTKDGKGIFLLSDEGVEFKSLSFYDFTTRKVSKIVEMKGDIEDTDLSEDGATLAFTVNEGGYYKVYLLDTKTLKYRPLSNVPKGVVGGLSFNKDNHRLALTLTTPTSPSDVYIFDIKAADKAERWTFSEVGGLNTANFVDCQLVEFPTFDKDEKTGKARMIPAFLYLPKGKTGKIPVIVEIHGGPEGQYFPNFSARRQYWANELGVAVLVPNVRGSSGYGKTYLKLDNGALRENSVKDIGALLDWAEKQPNLDASRIAVFGGSYGGYMSLACMTNYNDRFKCGVDLFGISNFISFLKNTSGYRVDLRRAEYGDERDPKMAEHLQKISPLTNIKNITKPMFIYQGENDPRVPLSESEQMLASLKENKVQTWYVRAKDEGHGMAKKANSDYTYAAIALFFQAFLMK